MICERLGSTIRMTKETGETIAWADYDAWGKPRSPVDFDMNLAGVDNAVSFTSYTYDTVLDIYFAQARFYDQNDRRFISVDPIKDGVNWYAYCGNSPINMIDPDGLDAIFMTQSDGALGAGHSAIAIQDENDEWWFMSFEPVGNQQAFGKSTPIPIVGVVFTKLQSIEWNEGGNFMTKGNYDYRKDIGKEYFQIIDCIAKYDSQVYIEGDFTKSIAKATEYEKNPPGYFLTGRNCAWLGLEVLQTSTSGDTYKRIDNYLWNKVTFTDIHTARKIIVPNVAKNNIGELFGIK